MLIPSTPPVPSTPPPRRLCPDSAVKRLRYYLTSVQPPLAPCPCAILRFLGREGSENCAVRKLRLRRMRLLKGGKLRPHLPVR